MTRVLRIHETGGPEVLRVEDVTLPDPGPGQARVRHTAIGVNFIDTCHRSGLYSPGRLPAMLGMYVATRSDLLASAHALFDVIDAGVVTAEVRQRWSLAEASKAHAALESRQTAGASLLIP